MFGPYHLSDGLTAIATLPIHAPAARCVGLCDESVELQGQLRLVQLHGNRTIGVSGVAVIGLLSRSLSRWRCKRSDRRRTRHMASFNSSAGSLPHESPYQVTPHAGCSFGGSVYGYDVRNAIGDPSAMAQIRADMNKYRLLVFKGQCDLTGEEHIALSEKLGSMDHGLHRPHPKASDPRLLRVSNDETQGFVSVGTSGWHVDGVMLKAPFSAQTMHFLNALEGGDTLFLGLNELFNSLEPAEQDTCRRLWFISGVGDDLSAGDGQVSLLPLVYKHPYTGEDTMCFHLGKNYCLGWIEEQAQASGGLGGLLDGWGRLMAKGDKKSPDSDLQRALYRLLVGEGEKGPERFTFLPPRPAQELLQQAIDNLSGEARKKAIWRQEWADGDLALIDNMAVAHLPTPGTQKIGIGVRLFHRTTMVDPEAAMLNSRGAPSVLLAGGVNGSTSGAAAKLTGSTEGGFLAPKMMRYIISALMACSPDPETRGGEQRAKIEAPAREEALAALEAGGHSITFLLQVDEEVRIAREQGNETLGKVLKKLMLELHPDRNQDREGEIVPVFKYLRKLREEQRPKGVRVKGSVVSRLRLKASQPKEVVADKK